jgi:probable F420-dependent oxidoreductase
MPALKFGFITTEGGGYYQEALSEAVRGEELGFDSVWLEEHHGVKNHYWPSPLVALAGYATRTSRVRLGTDILVLPFYHPVRVAEDVALLDVMSQGRFIFGAAIGYRPQEFELYEVSMDNRGARYVEQLKIIRALWTQDRVDFEGKFYRLSGACIEPKPLSRPHPPIWLGGWGDLSIKRAAELGDVWIPGPTANLEKLLAAQRRYHDCLATAGKEIPGERPVTREVIIADTDEQAFGLAEKYLLINYRDEYGGGWQHPLIGQQDAAPVNQLEALALDRFIIGNPERCIRAIQRFVEIFGMNHLICRLYFPGMPHVHILHELELLSREVMPAFRA